MGELRMHTVATTYRFYTYCLGPKLKQRKQNLNQAKLRIKKEALGVQTRELLPALVCG
jgi:hypothetical protein